MLTKFAAVTFELPRLIERSETGACRNPQTCEIPKLELFSNGVEVDFERFTVGIFQFKVMAKASSAKPIKLR